MLACLAAAAIAPLPADAQPVDASAIINPYAVAEDPEAFLHYQIEDSAVDIFLSGGWAAGLSFAGDFSIDGVTGTVVWDRGMAGYSPVPFYQRVDLAIAVWLDERYFVDAAFSEAFDESFVSIGYVGLPGEVVQYLAVGTRRVGLPAATGASWLQDIMPAADGDLGAAVSLASSHGRHDFALRVDATDRRTQAFIGEYRVTTAIIAADNRLRGYRFLLPVDSFTLWEEAPATTAATVVVGSDGRRYRRLTAGADYGVGAEGIIELRHAELRQAEPTNNDFGDAAPQRAAVVAVVDRALNDDTPVMVSAIDSTGPVADHSVGFSPTANSDFDTHVVGPLNALLGLEHGAEAIAAADYAITLGTDTAIVLYRPGMFSPFEILDTYRNAELFTDREETDQFTTRVVTTTAVPSGADSLGSVELLPVSPDSPSVVLATNSPAVAEESLAAVVTSDALVRYPLLRLLTIDTSADGLFAAAIRRHYRPVPVAAAADTARLQVQRRRRVTAWVLEEEPIAGSVELWRNGVTERRFRYDANTQTVEPLFAVGPLDRIEIRYRVAGAGTTDLVVGIANRFDPAGDGRNELAADVGFRWSLPQATFTTQPGEAAGRGGAALTYRHSSPQLSADFGIEAGFSVADITGRYAIGPPATAATAVAATAVAATAVAAGVEGAPTAAAFAPLRAVVGSAPTGFDPARRGLLLFRDFRLATTGAFLPYTSDQRPAQELPVPVAGGAVGPSIAGPGPVTVGTIGPTSPVVIADFQLDPTHSWVSLIIPHADQVDTDLRTAVELRVLVSAELADPTTPIRLQLGAIGEDLDGSAAIQRFNGDGFGLPVTLTPGRTNYTATHLSGSSVVVTNDLNANGRVENDESALIVTRSVAADQIGPAGEWRLLRFRFTDAERARLVRSRGLRVVIGDPLDDRETAVGGTLRIADIELITAGTLHAQWVSPAADAMLWAGPSAAGDADEIRWSTTDDQPAVQVARQFAAVPQSQYNEFTLTFRACDLPAGTADAGITVALSDVAGTPAAGIWIDLPLSPIVVPEWFVAAGCENSAAAVRPVTVRLPTTGAETAYYRIAEGEWQEATAGVGDSLPAQYSLVTVTVRGFDSGTLFLTAAAFVGVNPQATFSATATVAWNGSGLLVGSSAWPIFRDPALSVAARYGYAGDHQLQAVGNAALAVWEVSTAMGATVEWGPATAAGQTGSVRLDQHLRFPHSPSPLRFSDWYSHVVYPYSGGFRRLSRFMLEVQPTVSAAMAIELTAIPQDSLTQNWSAQATIRTDAAAFALSAALSHRAAIAESPFSQQTGLVAVDDQSFWGSWVNSHLLWLRVPFTQPVEPTTMAGLAVAPSRTGSLGIQAGQTADSLRPRVALELGWRRSSTATAVHEGGAVVGLDWHIEPVIVTWSYSRRFTVRNPSAAGGFGEDVADLAAVFAAAPGVVIGVPFYDLVAAGEFDRFTTGSAGYAAARAVVSTTVGFSRGPSFDAIAILAPVRAEISVTRTLDRVLSAPTDLGVLSLQWTHSGANLFGRLANQPLFDWFRGDELALTPRLSVNYNDTRTTAGTAFQISLGYRIALIGLTDAAAAVPPQGLPPDRLQLEGIVRFTDAAAANDGIETGASYMFFSALPPIDGFEEWNVAAAGGGHIAHHPRVDLRVAGTDLVRIDLGYRATLVLPAAEPRFSEQSAEFFVDLGMGWQLTNPTAAAGEQRHQFGFRGAVELSLAW